MEIKEIQADPIQKSQQHQQPAMAAPLAAAEATSSAPAASPSLETIGESGEDATDEKEIVLKTNRTTLQSPADLDQARILAIRKRRQKARQRRKQRKSTARKSLFSFGSGRQGRQHSQLDAQDNHDQSSRKLKKGFTAHQFKDIDSDDEKDTKVYRCGCF